LTQVIDSSFHRRSEEKVLQSRVVWILSPVSKEWRVEVVGKEMAMPVEDGKEMLGAGLREDLIIIAKKASSLV
jgi:hypothetical protein